MLVFSFKASINYYYYYHFNYNYIIDRIKLTFKTETFNIIPSHFYEYQSFLVSRYCVIYWNTRCLEKVGLCNASSIIVFYTDYWVSELAILLWLLLVLLV